jgi:hypothetical protein
LRLLAPRRLFVIGVPAGLGIKGEAMKTTVSQLWRSLVAASLIITSSTVLSAQEIAHPQDLPDSPGAILAQNAQPGHTSPVPPSQHGPTPVPPAENQPGQAVPVEPAQTPAQTQPVQTQPTQSAAPAGATQSAPQNVPQPQEPTKPVGTAVAPPPSAVGSAASNPAGAAIAPAKQSRVRVILISVGALVGAGVALGAVAALSSSSPSRPPGAR